MDRYGPGKNARWFDVFLAGTAEECAWTAEANVSWAKLSQTRGVVGTAGHDDTRVTVEIDWDAAAAGEGEGEMETAVEIAVDSPCRKWDKSRYAYGGAKVHIPVRLRSVPGDFARGFVESDGYVAIEAPHYQAVTNGTSSGGEKDVSLHVFEDYTCNPSDAGDLIADTPQQSISTDGCPVNPVQDSCPSDPGVDSIHNVMDYSYDSCYEGFTADQVERYPLTSCFAQAYTLPLRRAV